MDIKIGSNNALLYLKKTFIKYSTFCSKSNFKLLLTSKEVKGKITCQFAK